MTSDFLLSPKEYPQVKHHEIRRFGHPGVPWSDAWTFHYLIPSREGNKNIRWEDFLKPLHDFRTLEDFFALLRSIEKPENIPQGCRYYVFMKDIRPLWEDPANNGGYQVMLDYPTRRNDKTANVMAELWIDLAIHILINDRNEFHFANGIEFNNRGKSLKISIWFSKEKDVSKLDKVEEYLRDIAKDLPGATVKREKIITEEGNLKTKDEKTK